MSVRLGKSLLAAMLIVIGIQQTWHMWFHGDRAGMFVEWTVILILCGLLLHNAYWKPVGTPASSRGWRVFWTIVGVLSVMVILGSIVGPHRPV